MLLLCKQNIEGIFSATNKQIWYDVCLIGFDNVCLLLETTLLAYTVMFVIINFKTIISCR